MFSNNQKIHQKISQKTNRRPIGTFNKGFTLTEIMIVLVIIGLLAGVVTINVRSYLIRGRQTTARKDISTICEAIDTFYATCKRYPTNEEGLAILTQKSEKLPEPLIKDHDLKDPWDNPYQYNQPGRQGPYEVISYGLDGREGGDGEDADIVSWDLKE